MFLSTFDPLVGPKITHSVPAFDDEELERFKSIPRMLDMTDNEQFFVNSIENIYSANYYFSIMNKFVRGNKSLLLLSIVIQAGPNEKKDELLAYLDKSAPMLRGFARLIASDAMLVEHGGIFSSENHKHVMDMLHELHGQSFASKEFETLVNGKKGKIVVVGQDGINSNDIIYGLRSRLLLEASTDLKTRMTIHAIKEMEFHEFHCPARDSDVCLEEECPVCMELGAEADVVIYMLNKVNFTMHENIKAMITYFKGFTKRKDVPFFIFILLPSSTEKESVDEFIMAFKETLKEKLTALPIMKNLHVYALEEGDTATFKRAMGDLIKLVV
nr:hypothetical protein [Candidatus Sigynarchaeota archaeon]